MDLGVRRRLVRGRNTGKLCIAYVSALGPPPHTHTPPELTLDLPAPGLLVESLGIPLFDDAQRRVHKHLDERNRRVMRLVQLSRELSVRDVRRDKGRQGDACRGRKEERDFADSTDVFFPVLGTEAEVLARGGVSYRVPEERTVRSVPCSGRIGCYRRRVGKRAASCAASAARVPSRSWTNRDVKCGLFAALGCGSPCHWR